MKVYFNRIIRRGPWGGGAHFLSAMVDRLVELGHTVQSTPDNDTDIIFVLDPRHEDGGMSAGKIASFKATHPKVKVLFRVNECDARKGTHEIDGMILATIPIADKVIFISDWLRTYFKHDETESSVIYNGCNLDWFYPDAKKTGVSHPIKLVTHHWSDNWMKGFEVYTYIDRILDDHPEYSFTYVGRYNKSYNPQKTTIIPPLYGAALGDELRKHDIYVTASKFEPCGMHHIEGAACGLPVLYHMDGGAIVNVCSRHGVGFSNLIQFEGALASIVQRYDQLRSVIDRESLDVRKCCDAYIAVMEKLLR